MSLTLQNLQQQQTKRWKRTWRERGWECTVMIGGRQKGRNENNPSNIKKIIGGDIKQKVVWCKRERQYANGLWGQSNRCVLWWGMVVWACSLEIKAGKLIDSISLSLMYFSIKSSLSKQEGARLDMSVTKERFHFYFKLVPIVFTVFLTVSPHISLGCCVGQQMVANH